MLKKRLCELVASITIASSIFTHSGCATPPEIDFQDYKEKQQKPHTNQTLIDAAILVAKPRYWYEYLRLPFEPVYEGIVASALHDIGVTGYTIEFNATWSDLTKVLQDKNINTIIVAGHGEWGNWRASDTTVTEEMLEDYIASNPLPQKKKLFIRHTCGDNKYGDYPTELLTHEEKTRLRELFKYLGAKNIVIDAEWNAQDQMFAKLRNRIWYEITDKKRAKELQNIRNEWNKKMNDCGKEKETTAFGTCAVDDPSKTRGYEGIVSPLEYLLTPIPKAQSE